MPRPRKFYCYYEYGLVRSIIKGSIEARRLHAHGAFKSRREAEEYAAWHNYERTKQTAAADEKVRQRLRDKGYTPLGEA